jgi:hypothetical protein
MKKQPNNAYLHTDEAHKDWYNRPLMGKLGDKRGIRKKDAKKESQANIHKDAQRSLEQ